MCIFSQPSSLHEGPQWEEFCQVKILFHVRYQDFLELTEDGTIVWSILYNNYNEEINANLIDLLRSSKDNKENKTNDEEELFEKDNDE